MGYSWLSQYLSSFLGGIPQQRIYEEHVLIISITDMHCTLAVKNFEYE